MNLIQTMLYIMPGIIAIISFLMIIVVSVSYRPGETVVRTYERINKQLREKKTSLFDYEKCQKMLKANGAEFHFGKWMEPIKFLILRLVVMSLLFTIGIRVHTLLAIGLMVFGYYLPQLLLHYLNKKDNALMVSQVLNVYNVLKVQLQAGVHIKNAISECYRGLPKGRFRTGLEELTGDIYLKSTMKEAVNSFNAKFNNSAIDTLCSLILQAQESGLIIELLGDVSEQIKDMQSAQLLRKRETLERHITIYALLILSAVFVAILYAFIVNCFETWNYF